MQLQAAHEVAEREQAAREETERRLTAALEEGAALKVLSAGQLARVRHSDERGEAQERVTALEARLQTLAAMSDMDAAAQVRSCVVLPFPAALRRQLHALTQLRSPCPRASPRPVLQARPP